MARPILIFDGDCGFCRRWVERWKHVTRGRVDYEPSQRVAPQFPQIPPERFKESVVLVEPDGCTSYGAEAVFRTLAHARGGGMWLAAYRSVPGFAAVSEASYALVAHRRVAFSNTTRLLWGSEVGPPEQSLVRWTVLRGVGLVYLIAFVSLWVQIEGLIGSRGILPLAPWLDGIARRADGRPWFSVPTLFWLGASDRALNLVCGLGSAASSLLLLNVLPGPAALVAWLCYLSLYVAGRVFLGFQWDVLLLEAGVIACLWAPWSLRPRVAPPLSRFPLWLTRWLVFRLMFLSGFVKLASHDPSWRDLTAMSYHYQTQPLPSWTSWYAHHLPMGLHRAETGVMFVIELVLPFLVFTPRRPRLFAFFGFVALQVMIGATGNYGFFNLLTAVLSISFLDDAYLRSWMQKLKLRRGGSKERPRSNGGLLEPGAPVMPMPRHLRHDVARVAIAVVALCLFVFSIGNFVGRIAGYEHVPFVVRRGLAATESLQLTSNYGLFAVMTKQRPEIVIEGSEDGQVWKPYAFRWKPGDPGMRPRFVAPHMPRLDWQMWFAALGTYHRNPWLTSFMGRLLEASPPVLELLAPDPFEGRAPQYVRALVYDYRFTDPGTPEGEHAWWTRTDPLPYAPVLQRRRADTPAAKAPR